MPMPGSRFANVLIVVVLSATAVVAQQAPPQPAMRGDGPPPAEKPFNITRQDPALDALVDPKTTAELMASGFGLNEGPVWIREGQSGYLVISGLLDNVLYKISADKKVSVFLEKAGYTGNDVDRVGTQTRSGRSHVLLIGPSCASLDSQGRLIWCADNDRTVMRLEKDGSRTVLSAGLDGKRFSGPNDIVVRSDDGVYLTDNDFGLRDGGKNPDKQMPNGIWLIKDGVSKMVLDATTLGGIPNGIVLSPDEKSLYLTTSMQRIMRYEVKPDGTLGAGTLFTQGPGIGDGMKVDRAGQRLLHERRGPRHRPHHVADRHGAGLPQPADLRRRAEAADLRDERGLRRPRRQKPVCHGVRRGVSHPDEDRGRDARAKGIKDTRCHVAWLPSQRCSCCSHWCWHRHHHQRRRARLSNRARSARPRGNGFR